MDELPELPFEKVLSYLSLEDRLKSRAVSRRWYHQINRFKVKTLCYSQRPAGFILEKSELVSGSLAQNFISSTQFESFCNTFSPTILSNLKHLRLCDLRVSLENLPTFFSTLQSFDLLEELDIIQFKCDYPKHGAENRIKLTLPMLTSIWLKNASGLTKLTLDAPRLLKIKFSCSFPSLDLVHAESVEWLTADRRATMAGTDMKNLKHFYLSGYLEFGPTVLSSLGQLKEIHLENFQDGRLEELFEQKQRHGRTDLKIYLWGLLLNGPDDPAIPSLRGFGQEYLRCLAENPSRLADQIPFFSNLHYSWIEHVAPRIEMTLLKRFTDLRTIEVNEPVEDTDRFLNLLKSLNNIERLEFYENQPQDLFDRLPEHCSALQKLYIRCELSDHRFLFRLTDLMELLVECSIDAEAIRKVLENEFLTEFTFSYLNNWVLIDVEYPKQIKVEVNNGGWREVADLDAAIELITGESRPNK